MYYTGYYSSKIRKSDQNFLIVASKSSGFSNFSNHIYAFVYSEDFEEYTQEPVTWKRQIRNSLPRSSSLGRSSVACGIMSDLHYLSNYQCRSYRNDNDTGESKYKVIHCINLKALRSPHKIYQFLTTGFRAEIDNLVTYVILY